MMRVLLGFVLLVAVVQGQGGVCDGSEEPCNPDKPWMRGRIEKSCAPAGYPTTAGIVYLDCACRHTCDKTKDETQHRGWDGACEARCDPGNCKCPHPCQTT